MRLIFRTPNEEREVATISEPIKHGEIVRHISEYCQKHNIATSFVRTWHIGEKIKYDFGSHTDFFVLVDD